jgi:FixJ family two-component response regulator
MLSSEFVTFVVDDDRSVVKSLSRLLKTKGYEVRAFLSGREFLDKHDPDVLGCAILDMSMPDMSGLEIQQELAAKQADRPIIFLSGTAEVPASVQAMKGGAIEFLTKPARARDLLDAIAIACNRQTRVREERDELDDVNVRLAQLTPREKEVLTGVVSGMLNKQIAWQLGISLKTVKLHRGRMMHKMRVRNVADLVRLVEIAGRHP